MPTVQRVILDRERNCAGSCKKVLYVGEEAIKKHRKAPLKNEWYCPKCWAKQAS